MSKKSMFLLLVVVMVFGVGPNIWAMHIMEGYLQPKWCVAWGVLCIPFIVIGFKSISKTVEENPKLKLVLAMAGAFAFVLSALKLPSFTGSCSHPTGVGFGAILFGPFAMSVIGAIVLLFQAILLAHGGLTTLGANTFSMAIAGPFISYGIYRLVLKLKGKQDFAVFLSAMLGDLFTYIITSMQLAIAYPKEVGGMTAAFVQFAEIFAITQIPLAISEGLLTVLIFRGVKTYFSSELKGLTSFVGGEMK